MKTWFVISLLLATPAIATAEPAPEDVAAYSKLDALVGRWTIKGKEGTYLETCSWYEGRFHVVCHTVSTRKDGSKSAGLSILGYLPGQGYVYTGIGSSGRYETLERGTFADGKIVYTTQAVEDGKSVTTRISLGPPTARGFPFVVDTSTDGGPWKVVDSLEYLKLP